ncbi:hypothetical protein C8T65DRAFT_689343 [Cerioporus squamosus]|nr:hypothetical protein C8T65DRAFT_689343 [Cerioporus squamosus]
MPSLCICPPPPFTQTRAGLETSLPSRTTCLPLPFEAPGDRMISRSSVVSWRTGLGDRQDSMRTQRASESNDSKSLPSGTPRHIIVCVQPLLCPRTGDRRQGLCFSYCLSPA